MPFPANFTPAMQQAVQALLQHQANQGGGSPVPDAGSYGGTMESDPNSVLLGGGSGPSRPALPGGGLFGGVPLTGANWDPRFQPGGRGTSEGLLGGVQSPIMGPQQFTMPGTDGGSGGSTGAQGDNGFSAMLADKQKDLEGRRKTRDEIFKHLLDNHYPTMKELKLGTHDLPALLLSIVGLLSGKGGQEAVGAFAPAYLGARQQGVDDENKRALGMFNAEQDRGSLAAKIAQQGVADASDDIEGIYKQQNQELARQDRLARDKALQLDRDIKNDNAAQNALTRVDNQYREATTFNGMMTENARRGTIQGGVPLPKEQVEDDYLQKSIAMNKTPVERYLNYINNFDKTRGMVPDKDMPKVEAMRSGTIDAIAGSDPALRVKAEAILNKLMPMPSSEKTLVAQKQQEVIQLAKDKFKHLKAQDVVKNAQMQARTEIMRYAAVTARANYENSLDNTSLRAYEIAQKEADKATEEFNQGLDKQMKWYENAAKVVAAKGEYEAQRAIDAAAAKISDPKKLPFSKMSKPTADAYAKWQGLQKAYPDVGDPNMSKLQIIDGAKDLKAWKEMTIKDMPPIGQRGMPGGPGSAIGRIDTSGGARALGSGSGSGVKPEHQASFDTLTKQLSEKYGNNPEKWPQNIKAGYNAARAAAGG